MSFRVSVQLANDTVCLSDNIEGSVAVSVGGTSHDVAAAAPSAVRVLLRCVEEVGKKQAIEHMTLIKTVSGPSTAHEEAASAALHERVNHFTTEAARWNPLPGVAVDPDNIALVQASAGEDNTGGVGDAAAASNSGDGTDSIAALPPQEWVAGGHYVYHFFLRLPPWLPPSYYYKPGIGKSHMSMRYTVAAFVVCGGEEASVDAAARKSVPQTTVCVPFTSPTGKARCGHLRKSGKSAKDAGRGGPGASLPLLCPLRFRLPAEAPQLLVCLPATQLADLTVLSALPKRELQQCAERALISPPFFEKLTYHVYKYSLSLRGLRSKPYTAVEVRITYDSSAAVLLRGRQQSVVRGCAALGLSVPSNNDAGGTSAPLPSTGSGGAAGGLTVMGKVVGGYYCRAPHHPYTGSRGVAPFPLGETVREWQSVADGDLRREGAKSPRRAGEGGDTHCPATSQACTEPAISGALRLRVCVRTGSVAVGKVRVELLERVRCADAPSAQPNDVYTLATYTHAEMICAHTSREFPVELALPKQFRHSAADKGKYPPPAGITTAAVHTTTWLQITFPTLHTVSEALLRENVVLVGEDVDLTDTVPFLPCACPLYTR
ncbi:hypothetical protein LSCM1_00801 [Leishmania martiniquensis]|uniref:Arrestin-like N-terminal domain-containing protein n=1 Tax=Leishmania martiniquensis TaxID=1580590 RepID=A0A836GJJ1_9TRYP|nr:hypothetical protein LSCM1_00801 [Leishmania martiniquensis]